MSFSGGKIQIFCKAPVVGQVKTRLIPDIGAVSAMEIHQKMAEKTIEMVRETAGSAMEIWCAPDCNHPFFQHWATLGITLKLQVGQDLGQRMLHALQSGLAEADRVILMGTDCPVLTLAYLQEADRLLQAGHDFVFGPAEDGGYVLVGATRVDAEVFNQIDWGTDQVWRQTQARLDRRALSWSALPCLWDVDRIEDLRRLSDELG